MRTTLLATCSVLALATSARDAAASTVTAGYAYQVGNSGTPASNSVTDPLSVDLLPGASDNAGNFVFGHDYGSSGSTFGTRSSGTNVYAITGSSSYTLTIANNTPGLLDEQLAYVLQGGQIAVSAASGALGTQQGKLSATINLISGLTTTPELNYAASLTFNSSTSTTPVFTESGLTLNPAGPTLAPDAGNYFFNTYSGQIDLGLLGPGRSETVVYTLNSSATGTISASPPVLLAFAAAIGYGGGGSGNSALARFGDPFGSSGIPPGPGTPVVTGTPVGVPEPASAMAIGAGLAGLAFMRRKRG